MRTGPQRTCLVTGGAGFIGSHLVEHLLDRGDRVVVIDNLTTGTRENLAGCDPQRSLLVEASVTDGIAMLRREPSREGNLPAPHETLSASDFDEIYHLAAAVGVRLVIERPIHTIETNVLETLAVLQYAAERSIPVLLASTSEVYGKAPKTPFTEDDDVVYGPTTFSRWSYACSKALDEYLALAHHEQHGLPVVIARFFNTVGPRQVGEYGMVLPRFVGAALAGKPLEVHGEGTQSRCFCDVRDVVPALPQLLRSSSCAGRIFNIGHDEPITIAELAKLVKRTLGSSSPIVKVPYSQAFGEGFDDLHTRQPDLTRIREAIGFQSRIPLAQTIRDIAARMQQTGTAPRSMKESVP